MKASVCAFCGRREREDEDTFVAGVNNICICPDCNRRVATVYQRDEIFRKNKESKGVSVNWKDFSPQGIKAYLDEYVVGQHEAKKALSVAVYNHYKRMGERGFEAKNEKHFQNIIKEKVKLEKNNLLFVGTTGVGKTYMIRTVAEKLKVPCCIVDATLYTQTGYAGEDIEGILTRLLQAADYDVKAAEWGIVYIDEFDKIAARNSAESSMHDIGKGVQQAMLKMVEGSILSVSTEGGRKHPDQKLLPVDTTNILFICGGVFEGIQPIIKNRLNINYIGFERSSNKISKEKEESFLLRHIMPEDLKAYGIIPELVGRLPVVVHLETLTPAMLKEVLTVPKNALIKQYKKLFAMEGILLTFTEEALDCIVERVFQRKLGTRGLRNVLEKVFMDAMFELPSQKDTKKLHVDQDYVLEKLATQEKITKEAKKNTATLFQKEVR